jgi:hypothetical protein
LLRQAGIPEQAAEELSWGRVVELPADAAAQLATAFALHEGLLSCVLQPTSEDGLEHMLLHGVSAALCDRDCPICSSLVERAYALPEGSASEAILDGLEHLRPRRRRDDADELAGEGRFVEVLRALPDVSRLRVLAFALDELATVTSGRPIGEFAAYARLRNDYLEPKVRLLFDALAAAPAGELGAVELATELEIDARQLGLLTRSLARSLAALQRDGYSLSEEPLELRETRPHDRRLRLRPRALAAWRALLRAERETASVS